MIYLNYHTSQQIKMSIYSTRVDNIKGYRSDRAYIGKEE